MNLSDPLSTEREIARALNGALQPALADDATRAQLMAARDAAQLLGLAGLDGVLEACLPHAGRPRPAELTPVLERVRRLVVESTAGDGIEIFRRADRELAALAAQLQALEWSETAEALEGRAPAVPTLSLADVLEDLPLADPESPALRVRLTAPVAAALRAALDWLAPPRLPTQPLVLRAEDSLLEITRDAVSLAGLPAADKVLSTVGGILGPSSPASDSKTPASWTLRVPTFAGRGTFLMVTQGGLRLALPWHSVLRICLVPASDLNSALRSAGHPVLEPLMPLGRAASEYPVALVAHGLKRAYVVADRLVWRLRAQPIQGERLAPVPVLSGAVETEEGDVYWMVDPGRLMARVETPSFPSDREAAEEELQVLGPENVEPLLEATDDAAIATAEAPAAIAEPPAAVAPAFAPQAAPVIVEPTPLAAVESVPDVAAVPTPPAAVESAPDAVAETAALPERPAETGTVIEFPGPKRRNPRRGRKPATTPAVQPLPAPAVQPPPESEPKSTAKARRALVVEDSIVARVFLQRLLERQGFEVLAVASAAELGAALDHSWSLICVDVDLPDAPAESVFTDLFAGVRRGETAARIVALVRDAEDAAAARALGVEWTLDKPFERESVEQLLEHHGFPRRR